MTTAAGEALLARSGSQAERLAVAHESEGHGQAHKAAARPLDLIDGEEPLHVTDAHPIAGGRGLCRHPGRGLFDGQPVIRPYSAPARGRSPVKLTGWDGHLAGSAINQAGDETAQAAQARQETAQAQGG
jgi:hypothetical protein